MMNGKGKKIAIIAAVVVVLGVIIYLVLAPKDDSESNNTTGGSEISSSTQAPSEAQWKKVMEFSGTDKETLSDVFTLSGGSVRITYEIETTTKGETVDSGTSLIYLLKDGTTKAKDADGNLKVAVQDVSVIGSKKGSEIVKKEAGKYYVDINTASVKSYKILVEEKVG